MIEDCLLELDGVKPETPTPELYGDAGLSLQLRRGEFLVVLGKSGDGKSTLLEMILGVRRYSAGSIRLRPLDGGEPVALPYGRAFRERNFGIVFQDGALFEKKSVRENLEFVLRTRGVKKTEWRARFERMLDQVGRSDLFQHQLDQESGTLSGGEKQRVALARMLMVERRLYMFDEPLASLDNPYRQRILEELLRLREEIRSKDAAGVYVTHNQQEALALGTRVLLLRGCRANHQQRSWLAGIQQLGTPTELYWKPRSSFVAKFIGDPLYNFVELEDDASVFDEAVMRTWQRTLGELSLDGNRNRPRQRQNHQHTWVLGFRPESVHLGHKLGDGLRLKAQLQTEMFQGEERVLVARVEAGLGHPQCDLRVQIPSEEGCDRFLTRELSLFVPWDAVKIFYFPLGYREDDDNDESVGYNATDYALPPNIGSNT